MSEIYCGTALVRLLEDYGVETVFGIPGVHTLDLYRGLDGSTIRHILTRHEQGAGFMADGYARMSGKPGVCFLITGPGVTNAATAVGEAYADSVPLLVISSVNARRHLGKGWGHLHEITDQSRVMAPLTAFSATALSPEDVPDLVHRAFTVFRSGRPRPCHIEIPIDVLEETCAGGWRARPAPGPALPDPGTLAKAAQLLLEARRPVILAGGGALGAGKALASLAERLEAPVLETTAAKGLVSEEDPRCLGCALWTPQGMELLTSADVVLAVGTEIAPTETLGDEVAFQGRIVRVDLDPAKTTDQYESAVALVADAKEALEGILSELGNRQGAPDRPAAEVVAPARKAIRGGVSGLARGHVAVLDVLRQALPDDAAVFCDMTQLAYSGNTHFPARQARGWIYPSGFGTLGYGLPAAIGGALAAPRRKHLVVVGDHGFLYSGQELATAVEHRLPLVVLLWNNRRLGQIRDEFLDKGIRPQGVDLHTPDFAALARAYGCEGRRPGSLDELAGDLAEVLGRDQDPCLIEVGEELVEG